jgi:hypothetical protein
MERSAIADLAALLSNWEGQPLTVRVLTAANELVAVFNARLGARSSEGHPPFFWPLDAHAAVDTVERRGIYVHPDLLTDVEIREGQSVAEFSQDGVILNLRRVTRT